ncbi:MAG TPA: FecR family protein [Elusimicrobiota bacterium]|nr:FecR family protein [Elusimicrobiota bacterium]
MKRTRKPSFLKTLTVVFSVGFFLTAAQPELIAGDVAAVLTQILGALFIKAPGKTSYKQAKKGEFIYEGSVLKTGQGDKAALTFVNGIEVKMNQTTQYTVRKTHPSRRGQGNDTGLQKGQIWFKVLRKGTKFQIKTPVAAVSIRGTEGDVKYENGLKATCYEGKFRVASIHHEDEEVEDNAGSDVEAGQQCTVNEGKPPEVRTTDKKETWQNEIASKGKIEINLGKAEAPRGEAVRVTIAAYDTKNNEDKSFEGDVRVYSDREDAEFSVNGQSGWANNFVTVKASGGKAEAWVRAIQPGSVNVGIEVEGYDVSPVRYMVAKAARRELDVEIETEKGEKKQIRLKFRR